MFPHGPSTPPPIWEQAMDEVNNNFDATAAFMIAFGVAGVLCAIILLILESSRR